MSRILDAIDGIKRAFGAPGDFGYDTPQGQALFDLYSAGIEVQRIEDAKAAAATAEREACARIVDDNGVLHTSEGDVLRARIDGDRSRLAYAVAIRARSTAAPKAAP
jgi:hypothetical protein